MTFELGLEELVEFQQTEERKGDPVKGNSVRKKYWLIFGMVENYSLGSDCEGFFAAALSMTLHHFNYNYFSLCAFLYLQFF